MIFDGEGISTGPGIAELLCAAGAKCILVTPGMPGGALTEAPDVMARVARLDVALLPQTYLSRIGDGEVMLAPVLRDSESLLAARIVGDAHARTGIDAVVLASMRKPANPTLEDTLDRKVDAVYVIGHALAPRHLRAATYEGQYFARLTSAADVRNMTERAVELYGGIDVLVNNAYPSDAVGAGLDGPIATQTEENFERQIQVDVYGVFRTCKYVIPELQRRGGGSIINISALVSVRAAPGQATYSIGKGAIHSLTWSIAADYGRDWIRANVVIVGFVPSSDYTKWLDGHPVAGPQLRAMGTLSRTGTPDDVANACVYLASDESSFVTGATLNVDGGIGIKLNPPISAPSCARSTAHSSRVPAGAGHAGQVLQPSRDLIWLRLCHARCHAEAVCSRCGGGAVGNRELGQDA